MKRLSEANRKMRTAKTKSASTRRVRITMRRTQLISRMPTRGARKRLSQKKRRKVKRQKKTTSRRKILRRSFIFSLIRNSKLALCMEANLLIFVKRFKILMLILIKH